MKKIKISIFCFSLIVFCCINKNEFDIENKNKCEFDNPLTDLSWLSDFIFDFDNMKSHPKVHIYQCNYKDGKSFLFEMNVDCPEMSYCLRNCEGNILCEYDEFQLENIINEYNLDYDNKVLIMELVEKLPPMAKGIVVTIIGRCHGNGVLIDVETPIDIGVSDEFRYDKDSDPIVYKNGILVQDFILLYREGVIMEENIHIRFGTTIYFDYIEIEKDEWIRLYDKGICHAIYIPIAVPRYVITKVYNY